MPRDAGSVFGVGLDELNALATFIILVERRYSARNARCAEADQIASSPAIALVSDVRLTTKNQS